MLGIGLGLTTQRRRVAASGPDLTPGLLAFWRFDGDGADATGNGYDLGTSGGVPSYSSGLIGQCMIAGTVSQETIPGTLTAWSLSAWVKLPTFTTDGSGGFVTFSGGEYIAVNVTANPPATYTVSAFGGVTEYSTSDAGWLHVILISDGDFYVNGLLAGNAGSQPPVAPAYEFGAGEGNDFATPFDLAGIWGRVLTPAEILTLYNGGAGFDPTA